jgi:hypothetical protein
MASSPVHLLTAAAAASPATFARQRRRNVDAGVPPKSSMDAALVGGGGEARLRFVKSQVPPTKRSDAATVSSTRTEPNLLAHCSDPSVVRCVRGAAPIERNPDE